MGNQFPHRCACRSVRFPFPRHWSASPTRWARGFNCLPTILSMHCGCRPWSRYRGERCFVNADTASDFLTLVATRDDASTPPSVTMLTKIAFTWKLELKEIKHAPNRTHTRANTRIVGTALQPRP